jgi:site-specific DNA-methyltransferase (adenine-specific)
LRLPARTAGNSAKPDPTTILRDVPARATKPAKRSRSKTSGRKNARPTAQVSESDIPTGVTDFWRSPGGEVRLIHADSIRALEEVGEGSQDVIFADPPYFLSNGGTTCKNGKRVSVHKGKWDKSKGADENHDFNRRWLEACQRSLADNGTIWVSGTSHVIFSVGFAMQQLGFKILNEIVWEKPNPPPNLSCRYFTHSTEIVLWAAKNTKAKHHFAYADMKVENGGKQMKNVWGFTAPGKSEKLEGKHPTQKPLRLLDRLLRASCPEGGSVLDPFNGSGTTGLAALQNGFRYTGVDINTEYLDLTRRRMLAALPELGDADLADVG